ncbi:TolC family protein [Hyalangium rubrum]|uniref:TolC family protein n=1 Tax=Hyalangium rubrum TaxID=3103134 RepID=A0ABU5HD31_9BACT|nr:TolC family protein [Hyalangium sp. s54d21]MDY7231037.1 TolC family protein [Hyalangium sp. s54d21]
MFTARLFLGAPLCACLVLTSLDARAQTSEPAPPVAPAAPTASPSETPAAEPLTLERAVELASEHNERALAAQQRAEAADARVARARAFFFPELTVTGTYTRRLRESVRNVAGQPTVLQRRNALGATAVARMSLFDARGFPLYRAARLEGEAAELESREERRLVAFEAADAFLTTLGTQQVYEAAVRRLDFAQQTLLDAKARAEAGLASTNDVTRAELEVSSAEVELAQARGEAQASRLELGYLLVAPVEGALALPEPLLAEASRSTEGLSALAQGAEARRLDLLSTRLRVQAQEASAREPLARLFPTLGVSGQYRITNESGLIGNQGDGFVALDLTWNLFDGGERYAERRERVALTHALELEATARTRRVGVDIQRAQVALDNARAALRQSELAATQARRNAEETGILYRQGLSTALAVADASLRLFEAEVELARTRYSLGVALLDLRAAVGLDPLGKEP